MKAYDDLVLFVQGQLPLLKYGILFCLLFFEALLLGCGWQFLPLDVANLNRNHWVTFKFKTNKQTTPPTYKKTPTKTKQHNQTKPNTTKQTNKTPNQPTKPNKKTPKKPNQTKNPQTKHNTINEPTP